MTSADKKKVRYNEVQRQLATADIWAAMSKMVRVLGRGSTGASAFESEMGEIRSVMTSGRQYGAYRRQRTILREFAARWGDSSEKGLDFLRTVVSRN